MVKIFLLAFFGSFLLGFDIFYLLSFRILELKAVNKLSLPRAERDGDEVEDNFTYDCQHNYAKILPIDLIRPDAAPTALPNDARPLC